jgi:MFS family permease
LKRRGTFQGYMNIIFATGTSLGAPLGGVVADYFGWRWSFGIQIPLIIVSTLIVCFRLRLPARAVSTQTTKEKLMRVDFAGATTLVSTPTTISYTIPDTCIRFFV